ncbi:MAG TPA: hypothetical protein VH088_01190 [Terriglobales bacterium]|nr:hypothetical protein [Terriglobales bacterium]
MFPQVEITQQFLYEQEHLIMGLYFALAKNARGNLQVKDADLIAALTALARNYETLVNSGLHYEPPLAGLAQQAIVADIQNMVKEYRETEQKHLGYGRLRDQDVLRVLVFMVRMGHARTNGKPKSRAFAEAVVAPFPDKDSALAEQRQSSGLIIP